MLYNKIIQSINLAMNFIVKHQVYIYIYIYMYYFISRSRKSLSHPSTTISLVKLQQLGQPRNQETHWPQYLFKLFGQKARPEAFPSGSYWGGTWEEATERGNIYRAQNRKKRSKSNFKKYIKWRVNLWEIKSWCVKVLGSQQKVKKVLILHYSIDRLPSRPS